MFDFTDNLDELEDRIQQKLVDHFSWEDPKLANDVQQIVYEGQMSRINAEVDPRFTGWKENEPEYKARKGNQPIGVLTGEMVSAENIRGDVRETKETITIRYAGTAKARQKLVWFEEGGRKLWGLDEVIKAKIRERIREHVFTDLHSDQIDV
jgi:hypothetical protein